MPLHRRLWVANSLGGYDFSLKIYAPNRGFPCNVPMKHLVSPKGDGQWGCGLGLMRLGDVVDSAVFGQSSQCRSEKEVRLGRCRDKQEGTCMGGLGWGGKGSEMTSPRPNCPRGPDTPLIAMESCLPVADGLVRGLVNYGLRAKSDLMPVFVWPVS